MILECFLRLILGTGGRFGMATAAETWFKSMVIEMFEMGVVRSARSSRGKVRCEGVTSKFTVILGVFWWKSCGSGVSLWVILEFTSW